MLAVAHSVVKLPPAPSRSPAGRLLSRQEVRHATRWSAARSGRPQEPVLSAAEGATSTPSSLVLSVAEGKASAPSKSSSSPGSSPAPRPCAHLYKREALARLQSLAQQRRRDSGALAHTAQQTASLAACPELGRRVAVWLRYLRALEQGQPWDGPVPPPLSKRQARAVGKRLAGQLIEQGLVNHTPKAPKT